MQATFSLFVLFISEQTFERNGRLELTLCYRSDQEALKVGIATLRNLRSARLNGKLEAEIDKKSFVRSHKNGSIANFDLAVQLKIKKTNQ